MQNSEIAEKLRKLVQGIIIANIESHKSR